jgi:hypothetical protein
MLKQTVFYINVHSVNGIFIHAKLKMSVTFLAKIATWWTAMIKPTFQLCITQTDRCKFSFVETHVYFICYRYTIQHRSSSYSNQNTKLNKVM